MSTEIPYNKLNASSALGRVVESIGPDQFMQLITDGILSSVRPEFLPIWQEMIDEIEAEQEAAQQYDTEHRQYG